MKSGWFLESERKLGFHFAWNQMEIGWEKSFKIIWRTVNWIEFSWLKIFFFFEIDISYIANDDDNK